MEYEICKNGDILNFERDHGECYGGIHKTRLDCWGKSGEELYAHIKEFVGDAPAEAAREQGYCY